MEVTTVLLNTVTSMETALLMKLEVKVVLLLLLETVLTSSIQNLKTTMHSTVVQFMLMMTQVIQTLLIQNSKTTAQQKTVVPYKLEDPVLH